MINSDMWILIGIALFLSLAFILGWALGKSKGYSKGFKDTFNYFDKFVTTSTKINYKEENAKHSQCPTRCEECMYAEEISECCTDVFCKVFKTRIQKDSYCSKAVPKYIL